MARAPVPVSKETMLIGVHQISLAGVRDIAPEALGEDGHVKVMPAGFYAVTSLNERAVFAVRNGLYCLPTTELVDWLRDVISGQSAIEIGAGNGVIAAALGIPATDSWMQEHPAIAAYYRVHAQPTVRYGAHVEKLAAYEAVRKYRPDVVIASWVTRKYDEREHAAGGNALGVDELDVLKHCKRYVLIGNTQVHAKSALWQRKPMLHENPRWLYSRAVNGSPDFVAIWEGGAAQHH
ncbi:hypothetical protein [Paraburkholderia sp. BR14320]|uniref:hypothetical protein n=1 Tax=unclassified Paraburkholderia TaxID=2615204 RepID=UPI0034CD82BB